jgi:hypothetical protein
VLAPTGCLCACVTHPATDAGAWRPAADADAPDYLAGGSFAADDERDGLRMRWEGQPDSSTRTCRLLP